MRPLRVFTWHVHGNYLYSLAHTRHELIVPVKPGRPEGYAGRSGSMPWPPSVREVPADKVRAEPLDLILFQSRKNYWQDQFEILSSAQRRLPRIYLEHDPPREKPVGTRHPAADDDALIVHVTHFNALMWDNGPARSTVIEHGVAVPEGVQWTGDVERGLVIVNGMAWRGARLGSDLFQRARREVPLDLIGIGSEEMGGLGEVQHRDLPAFEARYRFLFNPIRYTSLGLAVCEAMMIGLPVVGLATTEMATVVENGVSGYVGTDLRELVRRMHELLRRPDEARTLSRGARRAALKRFGIRRFVEDWDRALLEATGAPAPHVRRAAAGGAA
ncbi:MAG TPA: glycosyltransferase [Candidatus Polarisedimenticolia bacterium]|nr:glycosyltransferase [Candidatus Polarisedimenticolia bacterium]